MFVVHVVRQFHPGIGGLESCVRELASAQLAAGHRVRVVTLDRLFGSERHGRLPPRDDVDGIEVVRIPYFGSRRYPIAWSAIRHIADADVVHVHGIDFFFDFLAFTAPLHRRKLVVSTHGGFFHTRFAARLKRLYFATVTRIALSRYAGVAAVSRADHDLFGAVRARGVALIENGVNIARFADAGARRPARAMIALGRFSENKRLERVISLLAELRRHDRAWKLKIAGRPWDRSVDDLHAAAAAAGVGDAVEIIASPADDMIRREMSDCSIIVSASDYEGFGLAVVEGLSAGLFPVLNDIPPFRDLVQRTGLGTVVDFSDPAVAARQFAGTWQAIERDFPRQRTAAMEAASRFAWRAVSENYDALYASALGNRVRSILDVGVQVTTVSQAVDLLDDKFAREERTLVTFANAHTLNTASSDRRLRQALGSSLVFNDGIGVDIASRLLFGRPFPDNLNGTDFVPNYLARTRNRYRIFLLGASPGVAQSAAGRIGEFAGRHRIVGYCDGYSHRREVASLVAQVRASRADVLLVGMGNPAQEYWLMEHLAETGCRLGFGVGALFDFLAGRVPRAPDWMRTWRIEWIYRWRQEPRRLWRRYLLGNPVFLLRVAVQWIGGARIPDDTHVSAGT